MADEPKFVIETIQGDKPLRKLDPSQMKIEMVEGAPLRNLEDEDITEMVESDEMFAETLFGTMKGIAVKRGEDWSVENDHVVAMVK